MNAGTIGTAFDVLVGRRYQPDTIPAMARPFAEWRPPLASAWANILGFVAEDATSLEAAAWAYALAIEAYRSSTVPYAIDQLLREKGGYNEHDLLAIASTDAVEELARLQRLAERNLFPHLGLPTARGQYPTADKRRTRAWVEPVRESGAPKHLFAPTFAASTLCRADADLICGNMLFEFKTRLGTKNSGGARVDTLSVLDLYQMVTYALFDSGDEYQLETVGLYSARYGRVTQWPLRDLLGMLADRPVDLADERATVWAVLTSKQLD